MPIQARRTGGGSGDSPASPTASPSTARRIVSSFRSAPQPHRAAIPHCRGIPAGDHQALRAREQEQEARRLQSSLSPHRGQRLSNLSLERFRTSTKYQDRPAAADIAFCVAAYANGMTENRIERALEDDYLSRDPSTSKRAAYIRRTMEKARRWAER